VESRRIGDKACIIVQRYDRMSHADGTITRLHQEDFCQALGFPPEQKYQKEGGPLFKNCISLLRQWSTTPVLDIRDFIDGIIFNVLIGNADAHGKNYSMIYKDNTRRLAPFYDLVCTLAWPELSKATSMKIGKAKWLNEITPVHFRQMAEETNLGWPMVRERMARLCGKIQESLNDAGLQRQAEDTAMVQRIADSALKRTSNMLGRLKR
jgi:serine/threonine-protein kinase HipA